MAKKIRIHLDDDLYEVLKSESLRRGISLSALVREHLLGTKKEAKVAEIYEALPDMMERFRREVRALKEELVGAFLEEKMDKSAFQKRVFEELVRFDKRLEKLEKALAITAYYAAFTGLMQSKKFFNIMSLSQKEWEQLKAIGDRTRSEAREKVRLILGDDMAELLQLLKK